MNEETVKLPLWRNALDKIREAGLTYGKTWQSDFFEKELRCDRDSKEFAFAMMAIRQEVERDDGFYIKSEENGARWSIVAAPDHESVAQTFDTKVRRYAVRSINLRSATLMNPEANLTEDERRKMEHNLEKASLRLILMSRAQSVANVVSEHAPSLLEKKK